MVRLRMVVSGVTNGNGLPYSLTCCRSETYIDEPNGTGSNVYCSPMRSTHFTRTLAMFLAATPVLGAQGTQVVDEGSFTVTIAGRTAGRENFRISTEQQGEEVVYVARADAAYGDRKYTPELRTDTRGGAAYYRVVRTGDDPMTWTGLVVRGRLSVNITTPKGPAARESIVPNGALVVDDDLFHQLFFVAQRTKSGRVPAIVPQRNAQVTLAVTTLGNETVQVGTRDLAATHLRVEEPGGSATDLWIDSAGRVLRVAVPARRLIAIRDDPPRE